MGTLVVVAGQEGATVFLNGNPQQQLTHNGKLRISNLETRDYVVRVSKSGFQDPPPQNIRIRRGEQTQISFSLAPAARGDSIFCSRVLTALPQDAAIVLPNP